jgi:hypothetical protein
MVLLFCALLSLAGANDDDVFHGHVPEELLQGLTFQAIGGWASFVTAGSLLAFQVNQMPEVKRQMRPRMLLVLLALDTIAGLFFGLGSVPVFNFSAKYNHSGVSGFDVYKMFSFVGYCASTHFFRMHLFCYHYVL